MWEIQLTALNFAAASACRIHFRLLFSLLTKPLIHPETGGQVSAGAAEEGEKGKEKKKKKKVAGETYRQVCVRPQRFVHTKSPELSLPLSLSLSIPPSLSL